MSKHPVDDLFASQLREHGLKPERATWEELQRRMNAKEERRSPFVWWSASAASVAVLLVGAWWLWSGREADEKIAVTNRSAQQMAARPLPASGKTQSPKSDGLKSVENPTVAYQEPVTVIKTKPAKDNRATIQRAETPTAVAAPTVLPEKAMETDVRMVEVTPTEAERTLIVQIPTPEIKTEKLVAAVEPPTTIITETAEEQPRKKRFRIGRVLRQLNKLKAGEPVEWEEVGIQPGALIARASEKVHEGKEKIADSYDNLRYNTFRKNSNNK